MLPQVGLDLFQNGARQERVDHPPAKCRKANPLPERLAKEQQARANQTT